MNEPKRPTLAAFLIFVVFVALLGYPLLSGQWLTGPFSDQVGGYAVRQWAAEQWRATGHVPLWNPMIFGGLPYVATLGHGDVFYPASFLRLVVSADIALGIWFVLHTILAGLFMYLFLRRLGSTWLGGVVGGLAYQLSGSLISMPSPGHDGKLAVATLLPLACLALYASVKERRWWGYGLLAMTVALSLLSPHVQMTYYLLLTAGLFGLYCAFGEAEAEPAKARIGRLALALGAVAVGFAVAAPQLLPFIEYVPHSPRAESYRGFEASASYAIPWIHVPEFLIGGFVGDGDTYWGTNPLKLHSEYLGLPVLALALLGAADKRRRLIWWLGGIGLLFLLISLGSATPFYRLWWSVAPYVKKTRAPGMAFFVVTFVVATYAALGTGRLERTDMRWQPRAWLIAGAACVLLAAAGVFGNMAVSMAEAQRGAAAVAHEGFIRTAALTGALALLALGALALAWQKGKAPAAALMVGLPLIVGADLWRDGKRFWHFQAPAVEGMYRTDPIVDRLRQERPPFRVLDLTAPMGVSAYPLNVLQGHDIAQTLGYFGFELRYYDELLGGKDEWRHLLSSTRLWNLLAVGYVITPDTLALPGYHRLMGPVETGAGRAAMLYQADSMPPYARVVPAAVKVDDAQAVATLMDPRLPGFDRIVLVPPDAPITTPPPRELPAPSPSRASFAAWRPGAMSITLDPAPASPSYLLVAENWYVDWHAMVDSADAPVLRGNGSLITVPVPAGARRVELEFRSASYNRGKMIAVVGLLLIVASMAVPPLARRRAAASA